MPELSDQEILSLLQSEETLNQGFNQLVIKYRERIYWHVRRMVILHDDADDVLQNIFIKIFRNIKSFKGNSGLYTWIYRISVNETITFLKQKRTSYFLPLVDYESKLSNSLQDDHFFTGDEVQMILQKAILTLPPRQRLVFNMKYFDEEMTFEELSKILDVSVGALKSSYHFAVKKIEKLIKTY